MNISPLLLFAFFTIFFLKFFSGPLSPEFLGLFLSDIKQTAVENLAEECPTFLKLLLTTVQQDMLLLWAPQNLAEVVKLTYSESWS